MSLSRRLCNRFISIFSIGEAITALTLLPALRASLLHEYDLRQATKWSGDSCVPDAGGNGAGCLPHLGQAGIARRDRSAVAKSIAAAALRDHRLRNPPGPPGLLLIISSGPYVEC